MGYVLCEHLRRIYLSYLVCEKDGIDLFLCEHCFFFIPEAVSQH